MARQSSHAFVIASEAQQSSNQPHHLDCVGRYTSIAMTKEKCFVPPLVIASAARQSSNQPHHLDCVGRYTPIAMTKEKCFVPPLVIASEARQSSNQHIHHLDCVGRYTPIAMTKEKCFVPPLVIASEARQSRKKIPRVRDLYFLKLNITTFGFRFIAPFFTMFLTKPWICFIFTYLRNGTLMTF